MVRGGQALPAAALPAASYSPLSVVAVGFKNEAIGRKLQGTHILVPQGNANMRSNCVLFSSDAFKGRAPGGSTLFTLYFGGTRPPFRAQIPFRMPHREETEFGEGWGGKNAMRCDGVMLLLPACLKRPRLCMYMPVKCCCCCVGPEVALALPSLVPPPSRRCPPRSPAGVLVREGHQP